MRNFLFVGTAGLGIALAAPASAQTVLTFEGIGNLNPVGEFYAAQGYHFSTATLAIVDADAGGSGNFANEPSASTVMFFLDANNAVLNVDNGFTTGFSFFYSSSVATTVSVYSGNNGTGAVLGTISLAAQYNNSCTGDPTGQFCNWTNAGVSFAGLARSINFAGGANVTGFDNITFGSAVAGAGGVPEPTTWAMMIAGFGMVGGAMRRRSTKVVLAA